MANMDNFVETKLFIASVDTSNNLSNFYMCSNVCPCNAPSNLSADIDWRELPESELNLQDRTKSDSASAFSKLVFYTADELALDENKDIQTFDRFIECASSIANENWIPENSGIAIAKITKFVASIYYSDVLKYHKYFGSSDTNEQGICSGFCYKPLFGVGMYISDGVPQETCISAVTAEMTSTYKFLSIIAMLAAGFAGAAFPAQYMLWKKYDDDEKKK